MDVLANNLANAATTGFKGEKPLFEQFLGTGPNGQQVSYVQLVGTIRDTHTGDLSPTGNPLDTGIDGKGYFSIQTPDGVRYTRDGKFALSTQGQLITNAGQPVLDDRGNPITLPGGKGDIVITSDGTITQGGAQVGKIGVVSFANEQDMTLTGAGLYTTTQTPTPDATSLVRQGTLEKSNIQPIVEMTKLMQLQRSYSNTQEVVESEDTRMKNAIDKLSRVA